MKKFATAVALAAIAGAASASTISYQIGTFESIAGDAQAYATAVDGSGLGAATSLASYNDLSLPTLRDFSLKSTITFYLATATTFDVRAGVDFGGGGALFVDNSSVSNPNDMWWAGSYSNPSQFLELDNLTLSAGDHTVTLYGFEGCCSGDTQLQYEVVGSNAGFTSFSNTDTLPAVPEAQNAAMLLAGLALVGTLARRRKQA